MNRSFKILLGIVLLILALILGFSTAKADQITPEKVATAIDNVWVLITAFLVFFMQAGFAMVEAGFTRAKNASNIVMKT